jgi:hypothetical protein
MYWREIQNNETDLLKEANSFERKFPVFYRDSSNTWTATEADALKFYQHCQALFGLFDRNKIVGLIYSQAITDTVTDVHMDMERGTDLAAVIPCIAEIRDRRWADGITLVMAWVLKRNRGVQRMLQAIGFRFSGLEMKAGSSHGSTLKWLQMTIVPEAAYD